MHTWGLTTIQRLLATASLPCLVAASGCALFNKDLMREFAQLEARHIAHSRLMVLAAVCVMLIPMGVWAALAWKSKATTLRSLFVLTTVEAVLLAAFSAARYWFD